LFFFFFYLCFFFFFFVFFFFFFFFFSRTEYSIREGKEKDTNFREPKRNMWMGK
jgi:ATP-dependent Zn protease